MATSYDKSWPTFVKQTSMRPICANVLASAEGRISFKHISAVSLTSIREKMDMDTAWNSFNELIHKAVDTKMTEVESRRFFDTILFPKTTKDKEFYSQKAADKTLDNIISILHAAPGQNTKAAKGSLFGTLNALSYWTTHSGSPRSNSGRFLRAFGDETVSIQRIALLAAAERVAA